MDTLEILVPSDTRNLALIRDEIGRFAALTGFDNDAVLEITLSVDETVTNIIQHAYGEDPGIPQDRKTIEVKARQIADGLEILVSDNGRAFNPWIKPDPDLDTHFAENRNHGLGIYAVKRFMDRLEHIYRAGHGNTVTMVKLIK